MRLAYIVAGISVLLVAVIGIAGYGLYRQRLHEPGGTFRQDLKTG